MHTLDIQPRFTDYDMFGHVNNNSYMQYLDLAKALFFGELIEGATDPVSLSAVIVNINIDFTAPTRPGEPITVHTGVRHLGDRSFSLWQEVINPENGVVKAKAVTTLAGFDIENQTSAPLRDNVRAALSAHLQDT